MEAKLKKAEYACWDKSFSLIQRKEESRDAVVPDTQPDIAEVLFCAPTVLIRRCYGNSETDWTMTEASS